MEYRSRDSVVFHTSFIFWIIDKKKKFSHICSHLTMDGCRSKQRQGVGSEQDIAMIIRRCVTVSNSLNQVSDPRLIGSISPMIGQTSGPQCASEEMPQVKRTTHHITKHKHVFINKKTSNGIIDEYIMQKKDNKDHTQESSYSL